MEEATKVMIEKLKEAPLALKNIGVDALSWFNKVIPPETRSDKIKQLQDTLKNSGQVALAWVNQAFPPETRSDKIKQLQDALKNSGHVALAWVNQAFPPEMIKSIHKAKPYAIAAIVLVVAVKFFSGRGGGAAKMMKAPGRNYKIKRSDFQSNPKKYFGDLRARK
ncbi:hypothetical protein ACS0TY_005458 [Phlomoides rotata]